MKKQRRRKQNLNRAPEAQVAMKPPERQRSAPDTAAKIAMIANLAKPLLRWLIGDVGNE